MNGLSTLAGLISALSFPIIFIVLLYPHLAGVRGKWSTVVLFAGISIGTMLIAVLSSAEPHFVDQEWGWLDWGVMAMGSGIFLVFTVKKCANLKNLAQARNSMERGKSKGVQFSRGSKKGKRSAFCRFVVS